MDALVQLDNVTKRYEDGRTPAVASPDRSGRTGPAGPVTGVGVLAGAARTRTAFALCAE